MSENILDFRRASEQATILSLSAHGALQAAENGGGGRTTVAPDDVLKRLVAEIDPRGADPRGADPRGADPRDPMWWQGSSAIIPAMRIYWRVIVPLLQEARRAK